MVVCQDKDTAEWAVGPFHLGPDDWKHLTVRPLVLGPGNVPVILDPEEAAADLAMATFAAMTHGRSPDAPAILKTLAQALGSADREALRYYSELLDTGLGDTPARRTWRKLMKNGSYFPGRGTFVEETYLEGKAEGKAEGEAVGAARSVLRLLEMRGIPVTPSQRDRALACTDLAVLDRWLELAFRATDAEQVFDG